MLQVIHGSLFYKHHKNLPLREGVQLITASTVYIHKKHLYISGVSGEIVSNKLTVPILDIEKQPLLCSIST